jgi:hypothetical protein
MLDHARLNGCDKVIVYLTASLRDGFHIDVKAVYQPMERRG